MLMSFKKLKKTSQSKLTLENSFLLLPNERVDQKTKGSLWHKYSMS